MPSWLGMSQIWSMWKGSVGEGFISRVADAGAGGHVLELAGAEDLAGTHGIFVLDGSFEDVTEDLHVAVGVFAEAALGGDDVLVDDAEGAEAHVGWVIVVGEAEGEV